MNFLLIFTFLAFIYSAVLIAFFIGLFRNPHVCRELDNFPTVSVIVAARNEEEKLPDCLSSLLNQTYPDKLLEIILVDDNSTDKTLSITESFAKKHSNLKVIRSSQKKHASESRLTGKQAALDLGIQSSNGEIILSTDADCVVPPTWVEGMVASFSSDEIGIVTGFSLLRDSTSEPSFKKAGLIDRLSYLLHSIFIKLQSLELLSLFSAFVGSFGLGIALGSTGNNIAYRREVYDELGGFANLGFTVAEDNMLVQWADKNTNWRILPVCNREVNVKTYPMETFLDFLQQRIRWASNSLENRPLLVGFMVAVYGFYLFIPVMIAMAFLGLLNWTLVTVLLLLKIIPEFLLVWRGLHIFGQSHLMKYFPLVEFFQWFYVMVCGVAGLLGRVIWKERKY